MPANAPSHKVALITGAGRRIGRSIALDLGRAGWSVAVHYRNSKSEAGELVGQLQGLGVKSVALCADLADFNAMRGLIDACTETIGAPACLVNNASEFLLDSLESLEEETWDVHQNINLKAPVFLAQAMLRTLPNGVEGNIINIIDQRVWKLTPDFFSYTISKAGLWTATRTLAQALAPRIRVNAIGPGPVFQSVHQTKAEFATEQTSTLLGRGPSPEEIAAAVKFILATPSMTGQMIALDGGQHLA